MIVEKIIVGEGTKYPLKGLLTLPDGVDGSVPAVVLVHGSGSSNMDEKVVKLTPFKDLAEGLAKQGIASIRYDKRSYAHPLKLMRDKSTVITVHEETVEDAIRATQLLRRDSRIDGSKIFLIGHSMGAMLAPRIDAEGGNYRGLIFMAGTPRTLDQVLKTQTGEMLASMKGITRRLVEGKIKKLVAAVDGLYELTDEQAKSRKYGGGVTVYYFKEMGEYPSNDYLTRTEKPLLFLQGDKDSQVKVDIDFGAYQSLLERHPNATFKLYPGLNHAFVPALYEGIMNAKKEFSVPRHIGGEIIGDIAGFIRAASKP